MVAFQVHGRWTHNLIMIYLILMNIERLCLEWIMAIKTRVALLQTLGNPVAVDTVSYQILTRFCPAAELTRRDALHY